MGIKQHLEDANDFLAPVLSRDRLSFPRASSVIEALQSRITISKASPSPRHAVIKQGLWFIQALDHDLQIAPPSEAIDILHTLDSRRIIDALLDLVSLEGIYPFLLPGVGVPLERRVKSMFRADVVSRPANDDSGPSPDHGLLQDIVNVLAKVAMGKRGLREALEGRTLVDLLAAAFQLVCGPAEQRFERFAPVLRQFLDGTSCALLFPILTSLTYSSTPDWLRSHVSSILSLLPLRENGVRETIYFVARSSPQRQQTQNRSDNTQGSTLSLEIIEHVSKLLSTLPRTLSPSEYFARLAPQLLALLDGDDPDLQWAGSYIIAIGILGKKSSGAPGTIGWKIFAEPLLEVISPKSGSTIGISDSPKLLIPAGALLEALNQLTILTLTHPNPGLVKRMIAPIILPLWSILRESKRSALLMVWMHKASQLLSTYLRLSADHGTLAFLSDNLAWQAENGLVYTWDGQDGIEIRSGAVQASENLAGMLSRETPTDQEDFVAAVVENVTDRVEAFLELVKESADDTEIENLLLHISRRWLLDDGPSGGILNLQMPEDNAFSKLQYAQLAQRMLSKYQEKIFAKPEGFLELILQVLQHSLSSFSTIDIALGESKVSLASLANMSSQNRQEIVNQADDSKALISTSLGLLSSIFSAPDLNLQSASMEVLLELRSVLARVSAIASNGFSSEKSSASNTAELISLLLSSTTSASFDRTPEDFHTSSREIYLQARQNLTSALPPIRAQGLSSINQLIATHSPVLDVPSTTSLLISLLQDDDEYIHLGGIRSLVHLSGRHGQTVLRMLQDTYVDQSEMQSLDVRLRVGEAIIKVIEALGESFTGAVAAAVVDTVIEMAGRRSKRPKTAQEKQGEAQIKSRKRKEANAAWGGEVPQLEEYDAATERLTRLLDGWKGKDDEEDIRIRTSALSILAIAIETNIAGVGSSLLSTAIDLAICLLKMETAGNQAILRRAAALLFLSIVRSLDKAREEQRSLGFGLAGESLEEVMEVLRLLRDTDEDEMVRGHVSRILEALDIWKRKTLLGLGSAGEAMPQLNLGSRLRGLDINPDNMERNPMIEEI